MVRVSFSTIVCNQTQSLLKSFTRRHIYGLERERHAFQELVSHKQALRSALGACVLQTAFFDSRKILNGCFPELVNFCGGLAAVFPGSSQIESDFSVLELEKDEFRYHIMDLSLEGVLYAEEF